jgi:hypothetical protein
MHIQNYTKSHKITHLAGCKAGEASVSGVGVGAGGVGGGRGLRRGGSGDVGDGYGGGHGLGRCRGWAAAAIEKTSGGGAGRRFVEEWTETARAGDDEVKILYVRRLTWLSDITLSSTVVYVAVRYNVVVGTMSFYCCVWFLGL